MPEAAPRYRLAGFGRLAIVLFALAFAVPPAAAGPKPRGITVLSRRDAKSTRALLELFTFEETGKPQKATNAKRAARSRAEIVVLSGVDIARGTTLQALKKKKLIAIDYSAAQVFGRLGLDIRGGNCAHGYGGAPAVVVVENGVVELKEHEDLVDVFDPPILDPRNFHNDLIFGLHAPRGGELEKKIEVIARFRRGDYVPVARQGRFVLVCVDAPVQNWSPEFKRLVRDVAIGLHGGLKRERDENVARGKSEFGGLRLTVSMPARVAAGERISLSIVVENGSARDARYVAATPHYAVVVEVTTKKNETIPFTRFGQAAHDEKGKPGLLKPNAALNETVNLGQVVDLSLPGAYKATVRLALDVGKKKPLELEVKGLAFAVLARSE